MAAGAMPAATSSRGAAAPETAAASSGPLGSPWLLEDASAATFAAATARLTALESELRAKDAALRAAKAQCAQLSVTCSGLRRQLDAAEQRLAQAEAAEATSGRAASARGRTGRVALAVALRAEAQELRAVLLLWHTWAATSAASAASSAVAASRLVAQAQELAARKAEEASMLREALAYSEAREQVAREQLQVAAAASRAGPRRGRAEAARRVDKIVGRCWQATRLWALEAWRWQARDAHRRRARAALEERRTARSDALEVAVHALLCATQDAWWLHTVVGAWKVLVCAQALERVCVGVTVGTMHCESGVVRNTSVLSLYICARTTARTHLCIWRSASAGPVELGIYGKLDSQYVPKLAIPVICQLH